MIIVTGATGKLGRIVLDDLRTRVPACELAVLSRAPEKVADADRGVDVRRGDFDDPASLRAAFDGTDVLLLVSSRTSHRACAASTATRSPRRSRQASAGSSTRAASTPGRALAFLRDHGATEDLLRGGGRADGPAQHVLRGGVRQPRATGGGGRGRAARCGPWGAGQACEGEVHDQARRYSACPHRPTTTGTPGHVSAVLHGGGHVAHGWLLVSGCVCAAEAGAWMVLDGSLGRCV